MAEIIDIERDLPHVTREVICVKCLARFVSVAPETLLLRDMECGECGEPGYCVDTGQCVEGPFDGPE